MLPVKPGNSFFLPGFVASLLILAQNVFPSLRTFLNCWIEAVCSVLDFVCMVEPGCAFRRICCSLSVDALGVYAGEIPGLAG
jgi:hypothetical protein